MPNVTLTLDGPLLERGRQYARSQDMSFNALVRDLVDQRTRPSGEWFDNVVRLADEVKPTAEGRRWTRDELYRY